MQDLESECERMLTLPPSERPGMLIPTIMSLVELLLATASTQKQGPEASIQALHRAEEWSDTLDALCRGKPVGQPQPGASATPSPVAATSSEQAASLTSMPVSPSSYAQPPMSLVVRLQCTVLREKSFGLLRDAYTSTTNYTAALRYAKKAQRLAESITSVAQASLGQEGLQLSEAEVAELQRIAESYNPLRSAKNLINLSVLTTHLRRYNNAAEYSESAVTLLRSIQKTSEFARGKQRTHSPPTTVAARNGQTDPSVEGTNGEELQDVESLLAVALYNLGNQLEQCARPQEAQIAYNRAYDYAVAKMGERHPLTETLWKILSSSGVRTVKAVRSHTGLLPAVSPGHKAGGKPTSALESPRREKSTPMAAARDALCPAPPSRASSQGAAPRRLDAAGASSSTGGRPPMAGALRPSSQRSTRLPSLTKDTAPLPLSSRNISSAGNALPPHSSTHGYEPAGALRSHSSPSKPGPHRAWSDKGSGLAPMQVVDLTATQDSLPGPGRDVTSSSGSHTQQPQQQHQPTKPRRPSVGRGDSKNNSPTRGSTAGSAPQNTEETLRLRIADWVHSVTAAQYNQYARRFHAACVIQRAWRCSQARLERHNRLQVLYFYKHLEQVAALSCIVSALKRCVAQRKRREAQAKAMEEQAARLVLERQQRVAGAKLVRAGRRFLAVKRHRAFLMKLLRIRQEEKLELHETAAVLVQRWWHIIKVQKVYWRRRHEEIAEEKRRKRMEEARHRAAAQIQRIVRGRQGRAYVVRYRNERRAEQLALQQRLSESTDCVRTFLLEIRARALREANQKVFRKQQEVAAAARIGESWKGALQRRAMRQQCARSRRVYDAVVKIQRMMRRHWARRDLRVLRTIYKTNCLIRIEREFKQRRAAIRIQCMARQWAARRRVRATKAGIGRKLIHSIFLLQRVARGFLSRQDTAVLWGLTHHLHERAIESALESRQRLATTVQLHCRAYVSSVLASRLRFAVEAEEALIARRTRRALKEDAAATTIQAKARSYLAKKQTEAVRDEVAEEVRYVRAAILRIQCFVRCVRAKVELRRRKAAYAARREKQQLYAEVHAEVFATWVTELEIEERLTRNDIRDDEEGGFQALWRREGSGSAALNPSVGGDEDEYGMYDEL